MAVTLDEADLEQIYVADGDGGLILTAGAKETLIEAVGREIVDTTPEISGGQRRSQWKRKANTFYHGEWWHDHTGKAENADG
ncbi:hypothetical protein CVT26_013744 [Gymnopilus dilepis]|uniref:Uncharacterized protein n=1 Tax=Gymnopilus dilepis TaxID=231916 RepID=A0A409YWR9_9AGAR|nr:hypothetical protein CVT26_013744 [Gymnopilus dilepis]